MTTQDADDSTNTSDTEDGEANGESVEEPTADSTESVEAVLSEIASAPDGDVDEALSDIADGESSSEGEDETESTVDDPGQHVDPDEISVPDEFVAKIDETPTETVARAIQLLRADRKRLESELAEAREEAEEFESRLKRKQADFQNYKKRQKERLEDEKQRATEDLVERLLDVRDNLVRALDQDEDADIRGGVETTLEQFDQQLERENVEQVEPAVGEETDPTRHEVLATVESDQPEGTIAHVHRPGYEMAGKVIRPAQVTVSDGSGDDS